MQGQRSLSSGEAETDEFGVKEPPAHSKLLRKMRVLRAARGVKSWIRVLFHGASGNWCETTTKTQQHFLKSGNKMTIRFGAPGNWCEVMTIKLKGQGWSSTK